MHPSAVEHSDTVLTASQQVKSGPSGAATSKMSSVVDSAPIGISDILVFLPSLPVVLPFVSSLKD